MKLFPLKIKPQRQKSLLTTFRDCLNSTWLTTTQAKLASIAEFKSEQSTDRRATHTSLWHTSPRYASRGEHSLQTCIAATAPSPNTHHLLLLPRLYTKPALPAPPSPQNTPTKQVWVHKKQTAITNQVLRTPVLLSPLLGPFPPSTSA